MVSTSITEPSKRLQSLDAYRGLIRLAMASAGFALARVAQNPEVTTQFDGTRWAGLWVGLWEFLKHQCSHVAWGGCSFWDLIQPSFMFMVGVAMPFSYARREEKGESEWRMLGHVIFRSVILVLLGVFLSSNWSPQTNFTFANVLAQIGLGYTFAYLLLRWGLVTHLVAVAVILGGYWYFFFQYTIPEADLQNVTQYLQEVRGLDEGEHSQFSGLASHWNKHTNAAAGADRQLLNQFPGAEGPWRGRRFWVNNGGYQTLNFIPAIATMILGIMAGKVLYGDGEQYEKCTWLFLAGGICLLLGLSVDTNIWPTQIRELTGANWSLCPIVKRIWTPSWAIFSAGWTFWILAALYWMIDIKGWRRLAFPFVVVGMNSITMYCMAQLIKPWVSRSLTTHLTTVDAFFGCEKGITHYLFDPSFPYAQTCEHAARLLVLWLICLWLYRKKVFIRI